MDYRQTSLLTFKKVEERKKMLKSCLRLMQLLCDHRNAVQKKLKLSLLSGLVCE